MSESRAKLEQILELLLAEENEKAEEMLHEYVVSKARSEYERVLEAEDEVEESAEETDESVEETIDQSNDFEDDILADQNEITADETGLSEEGDEEEGAEEEGAEEGEGDLEDKVDDLEAELEELRADFEKLMAGDDDAEDADMGMGMDDAEDAEDNMMDSVEYDLDEEIEEDSEVVEEATKLQDKVAAPKAPADEGAKSFTAPKKHFNLSGQSVPKIKDGGEGNKGANNAKDHTPTNNMGIKPAKVSVPKA